MEPIKTYQFKPSLIEIEIKDLRFIKELPNLLDSPHKPAFYGIIWITEGEAAFHIDFREIVLKINETFVITPNQVCQFDTISDYCGKMILFTDDFFNVTELDSNFLYTSEILNSESLNKIVSICPYFMNSIINLLDEELKQPTDDYQAGKAQSCLRVILLEIERKLKASHSLVTNSLARRFYNTVEEHFHKNRNINYYLEILEVNEKRLTKEIKSISGKTPKAYIDNRIILEAKRLLVYSNQSAKEIAFELGFDEPTNFTKYFQKHTHLTPGQFRESTKP